MKIDSYNIGMESARQFTSSTVSSRSISIRANTMTGGQLSSFTDLLSGNGLDNAEAQKENSKKAGTEESAATTDQTSEKDTLSKALNDLERKSPVNRSRIKRSDDAGTTFQKLHQLMMKNILELLFGRKKLKNSQVESEEVCNNQDGVLHYDIPMESISVVESYESFHTESEAFSFDAKGVVKTSDGREIDININVGMSRTFASYTSSYVSLDALSYLDPLVINLDNAPAGLSDMKFFFDLDSDGVEEEISSLTSGSGYLALDKNGDGKINDGSELFGTKSGDGYKDLAKYDLDGNGWIDENDEVFDSLKIWVKDNLGNDCLYSLKDKGVGAIFLGNADTGMALRSEDGEGVNGYIRKTGIFLYESGEVGTTQHVDLVS